MNQTLSLHERWTTSRKLSFRYISIFFFLYIFPFPLNQLPWIGGDIGQLYADFWTWINDWAAGAFFGMDEFPAGSPGSGDRSVNWVQLFMVVLISIVGGTLWSVLDRHRKSYAKLWRWFHILTVYNLSYWLLVYGFIKAFGEQFGNTGIAQMLETYGESSPMRIMWTFLSASEAYEQFSGWSEIIAGVLLLFRRTRTLGALAAAGVMLNVFTMNMTYDVPVKIFSFRLMMQGVYIALADHKRLLAIFLTNKPVPALQWPPFFKTVWKNYLLLAVQVLLVGYILVSQYQSSLPIERMLDPNQPRPALYGVHDVEQFIINGDTLAPLTTDTVRWSKAFMDFPGYGGRQLFGIKGMDNNLRYMTAALDTVQQLMTLTSSRDTVNTYKLHYKWVEGNLHLDGIFGGDTVQIQTTYFDPNDFILKSRGFHWINEVPYNRGVPYR